MLNHTVDLDAVSSLYVFASTNEHSSHVISLARPTPLVLGYHYPTDDANGTAIEPQSQPVSANWPGNGQSFSELFGTIRSRADSYD